MTQCPFDKINYRKPIQNLPVHKASFINLKDSKEVCTTHSIVKTHYSNRGYRKLCIQCLDAEHISKDDIVEEDKFNEYLNEKLYSLRQEAKNLSVELANNLDVASFYGAIAEHADSDSKN